MATLSSAHRKTLPLLRDGTGWCEIGWEEALDLCAARIQALRAEPLSILHLDSSGNMGLMVQVPQHFFNLLGASRAVGSLCAGAGMAACQADFGRVERLAAVYKRLHQPGIHPIAPLPVGSQPPQRTGEQRAGPDCGSSPAPKTGCC
jgi:hypothetical protein